jgi:hypothetical protein
MLCDALVRCDAVGEMRGVEVKGVNEGDGVGERC